MAVRTKSHWNNTSVKERTHFRK